LERQFSAAAEDIQCSKKKGAEADEITAADVDIDYILDERARNCNYEEK